MPVKPALSANHVRYGTGEVLAPTPPKPPKRARKKLAPQPTELEAA